MTARTYYRLSLVVPLALPALLWVLHLATAVDLSSLGDAPTFIVLMLGVSLVYGGVPYAALALWTCWFISGKTERQIRGVLLVLPVAMAVAEMAFVGVIGQALGRARTFEPIALIGAAASVVLGYTYVVVVFVARRFVTLTDEP